MRWKEANITHLVFSMIHEVEVRFDVNVILMFSIN